MSWFSDVCFSLILVNVSSYNILMKDNLKSASKVLSPRI